jgi:hypothetical protein
MARPLKINQQQKQWSRAWNKGKQNQVTILDQMGLKIEVEIMGNTYIDK